MGATYFQGSYELSKYKRTKTNYSQLDEKEKLWRCNFFVLRYVLITV